MQTKYGPGVVSTTKSSNPVEDWLSKAPVVREQVIADLALARQRVAELEAALRLIDSLPPSTPQPASRVTVQGSLYDWVQELTLRLPGLTARDYATKLASEGHGIHMGHLYTYLNRLQRRGLIQAMGPKGNRRYYPTTQQGED